MSANHNLTPGKYPKEHIQYSKLAKVWNQEFFSLFTCVAGYFLQNQDHPHTDHQLVL
jgi:hypothetical protein